jgi:hypothetical protein
MGLKDFALVATLFNGKKVLVEPNFERQKVAFRYLSDDEVKNDTLDMSKKYIFLETDMHKTVEDGVTIVFCDIEATPVVLARL